MFLDEDIDPKTRRSKPRDLTNMSVAELADYKQDLLQEVQRIEADIARKSAHKDSIDALFTKKDKQ